MKDWFYHVGGSLSPDDPTYIKRQADDDLYQALLGGELCYVLNSPQTGKSSLKRKTRQRLENKGIKCVTINLTEISQNIVNRKTWETRLFDNLVKDFNSWENNQKKAGDQEQNFLSFSQKLNNLVEQTLIKTVTEKIVIFVDDIEAVYQLSFDVDDFFIWIINTHKKSNQELTFCLLGVRQFHDLTKDKFETNLQLSKKIFLSGFTLDEAQPLAKGLEGKISNPRKVLEAIINLTGGQPFLTQKLCYIVMEEGTSLTNFEGKEEILVIGLAQSRIIEDWEDQDQPEHLKIIRCYLLNNDVVARRLLKLYKNILQEGQITVIRNWEQQQLKLSGLVIEKDNQLIPYNWIYQQVFTEEWVQEQLDNICPYQQQFRDWLHSNKSQLLLLSGEQLEEAWQWSKGKNINQDEFEFLGLGKVTEIEKSQAIKNTQIQQNINKIFSAIFNDKVKKNIIKQVFLWAGNQANLIPIVCQIIISFEPLIKEQKESEVVERLIKKNIIEDWENGLASEHLTSVLNNLVNQETQESRKARLKLYKKILQRRVNFDGSREQIELLETEIVVINKGKLEVANLIYRQVFNTPWIEKQLNTITEKNSQSKSNQKPLILSILALTIFVLLGIPYITKTNFKNPSLLSANCLARNLDKNLEENIKNLQTLVNQSSETVDEKCQILLNELTLISESISLVDNNNIFKALDKLCQIPANSDNLTEAKALIFRWYYADSGRYPKTYIWRGDILEYIEKNPQCSALKNFNPI
ncbi:MAG TPA: hypothetical protein DCF68_04020 [Cyanothece sp. UBA12306]|nr:hypothetical protein [Cyanothece sp. UBA12306]